ncbi:MAG: histidine kinase dimerization/phosphoacceptor domain -containing protein [Bradyrhizobium sp.]
MEAALHGAEKQRIAALRSYEILDTPREEEFDDIVRVVSAICETPISVINLIDHGRQWFKAEIGLGVRETPLPASICAHAILQPGLFVIPDTLNDRRFSDNPLVTGDPHLRFYAGALLETSEGLPLGTICVLDYKPRQLNDNQKDLLRLMASQIMKLFELRRRNAEEHSARKEAEALARENATLAREGDHRVMNSLNLVSAVLALQSRASSNNDVKAQIADAQRRVQAIATVHQQLHLAGSLEFITIGSFLKSLCENLKQTAPACIDRIDTSLDHAEIRSDEASTLGLITAELLTNCFKHAYPNDAHGPVSVRFSGDARRWRLTVSDNGVGLPNGFDPTQGKSVGMRVITTLVRRLNAKLTFQSSADGTVFEISKD